jgi:hypothetical protein
MPDAVTNNSSTPEVAQYNENETELHLSDGEKMKFTRRTGGTKPNHKSDFISGCSNW